MRRNNSKCSASADTDETMNLVRIYHDVNGHDLNNECPERSRSLLDTGSQISNNFNFFLKRLA